MKKNQINGIMHDLLDLLNWRNPLNDITLPKTIQVDLLAGEVTGTDEDDLYEFYHEKIDWFKKRLNKLDAKNDDFKSAMLTATGFTESIKINFRNEEFSMNRSFGKPKEQL